MAGGHDAPHPEGGLEGTVRKIFPKNWQMSLAIMGLYSGLYMISKLFSGGKKAAVAAPAAHGHDSHGSDIPPVDSDKFGEWLGQEGSVEKLFASAA